MRLDQLCVGRRESERKKEKQASIQLVAFKLEHRPWTCNCATLQRAKPAFKAADAFYASHLFVPGGALEVVLACGRPKATIVLFCQLMLFCCSSQPTYTTMSNANPAALGAKRVIVVGAGWAGLSCARHLHARGVRVRILEAGEVVGGRARAGMV